MDSPTLKPCYNYRYNRASEIFQSTVSEDKSHVTEIPNIIKKKMGLLLEAVSTSCFGVKLQVKGSV